MPDYTPEIVSELGDNRGGTPDPHYDRMLEVCKDHPGQWVKVKESKSGAGRIPMESRGCQTRSTHHGDIIRVWAKWEEPQ